MEDKDIKEKKRKEDSSQQKDEAKQSSKKAELQPSDKLLNFTCSFLIVWTAIKAGQAAESVWHGIGIFIMLFLAATLADVAAAIQMFKTYDISKEDLEANLNKIMSTSAPFKAILLTAILAAFKFGYISL